MVNYSNYRIYCRFHWYQWNHFSFHSGKWKISSSGVFLDWLREYQVSSFVICSWWSLWLHFPLCQQQFLCRILSTPHVFEKSLFSSLFSSKTCLYTSSHIQEDLVPLPSPTTPLCNCPSTVSIGARPSPAEQRCKTSSGMKTSSIYRALRLDESFQRAFWKGSHPAALKAYKGKQACYLAS